MTKSVTPIETGEDLRAARLKLGLDMADFALAVGLSGNRKNLNRQIGVYERGERPVPLRLALLVEAMLVGYRPRTYPANPRPLAR